MPVAITEQELKDLSSRISMMNQGKDRVRMQEIFWKFWAYASPLIVRENREYGLYQDRIFTNVRNETNAIEDSLGIQGVTLRCSFNKNSAEVEIILAPEYQISCAVYEHMYARRHAIAEVTGLSFRYENFRSGYPARIYLTQPEIKLLNMADWRDAAIFFADASRRIARLFDLFFIVS